MPDATTIIPPKVPRVPGWIRWPDPLPSVSMGYASSRWYHPDTSLQVISAVEVAKDDDGLDRGPEYHISISKAIHGCARPARCTSQEAREVLQQFGLDGAEEDNHVPFGVVRNFWRPVADRFVGIECGCKDSEPAVVEDKGDFVWRAAPD